MGCNSCDFCVMEFLSLSANGCKWKSIGSPIGPPCAVWPVNILNGPNSIWLRRWATRFRWVKKWLKRLQEAPPDDRQVLRSHSRAHHTPYPQVHPRIVQRILEIREHPPENLQRTPGKRAILYYLHRDQEGPRAKLVPSALHAHQSFASCVSLDVSWIHLAAIIDHRIVPSPCKRFNSISRMRPVCRLIPTASSSISWKFAILWTPEPPLGSWPRPARIFTRRLRLPTVVHFLTRYGCPSRMTSSPRYPLGRQLRSAPFPRSHLSLLVVPGHSAQHLPKAMTRQKCLCRAAAPHAQPGMGASSVCLRRLVRCERQPGASSGITTRSDLKRRTACGNRPPQVAFPSLPALPPLPERVDPDRLPGCAGWLLA